MLKAKCDEIKLEALKGDTKTNRVRSTISQQFSVITGDLVSISLSLSVTVEISAVLSRALSALVTLSALSPPLFLPPPLTHTMHCCLTKFTEVILLEVTLFVLPTEVWMTEIYTGCSRPEKIHFIY